MMGRLSGMAHTGPSQQTGDRSVLPVGVSERESQQGRPLPGRELTLQCGPRWEGGGILGTHCLLHEPALDQP